CAEQYSKPDADQNELSSALCQFITYPNGTGEPDHQNGNFTDEDKPTHPRNIEDITATFEKHTD
ncbi:hypothetical protein OFC53_33605, partial [Escherichia coli]|nr:hypothetical protein [Escherichia coli]